MNRDRYDLPLTTASDRAAAHYRDGVDCMLSAWHGAEDAFDKAIAEDPGFALAHIGRARLHQLNMEGGKARAMAAQARRAGRRREPARKKPCRDHGRRDREQAEISRRPAPRRIWKNIRATRRCCRSCSARSASTRSRAVPTTTRQNSRSANATRGIMARTGGLSVTSAGRTPRQEISPPAGHCPNAPWRCVPKTPTPRMASRMRCSSKATWRWAENFSRNGCLRMIARAFCMDILPGTSR